MTSMKSITRCNRYMCWLCSESFSGKISGPNQRRGGRKRRSTKRKGKEGKEEEKTQGRGEGEIRRERRGR